MMAHADEVKRRQLRNALAAGGRWQACTGQRAETARLLALGGPRLADTPERVDKYIARESAKRLAYVRAGVAPEFFTERRIGDTLDLDESPPNDAARIAGIPVGRIVELDGAGVARDGIATGFLIAARLMLTNHHVSAAAEECRGFYSQNMDAEQCDDLNRLKKS